MREGRARRRRGPSEARRATVCSAFLSPLRAFPLHPPMYDISILGMINDCADRCSE